MMNTEKDRITEHYRQNEADNATLVSSTHGRKKKNAEKSGKSDLAQETAAKKKRSSSGKKVAAGKPKGGSQDREQEGGSQSVKTPSVMKLVEERSLADNQVIAAGKGRIPRQLRGIEPLSKLIKRENAAAEAARAVENSPMVTRDLTEMVIGDAVPEILRRFNACDCEICRAELKRLTQEQIPSRYVRLPELADTGSGCLSAEEEMLAASLKKSAVSAMIRLMFSNKKRNFHG